MTVAMRYQIFGDNEKGQYFKHFPAVDDADADVQGARHAGNLGLEKYHVIYVGSWGEADSSAFDVDPEPSVPAKSA